jgi:hypothetical protein
VLFIDEAYRLREGKFAQEALDELVGVLTHPDFKGKLLVIVGGYTREMDEFLAANAGLASRFPEHVFFAPLAPARCLDVLAHELAAHDVRAPALADAESPARARALQLLALLSGLPFWGNAREMQTLARRVTIAAYSALDLAAVDDAPNAHISLPPDVVVEQLQAMLEERGHAVPPDEDSCELVD